LALASSAESYAPISGKYTKQLQSEAALASFEIQTFFASIAILV
tara:strand:- start:2007 stop:2138 length:132 start_codon:yes stop_codon:yes gene_type:complete